MATAGPSNAREPTGGAPQEGSQGAREPAGGAPQEGANIKLGAPLSPWAARFPLNDDTFNFGDGIVHSGRAPLHPRLDPLNYHDIPQPEPVDRPSEADLDTLFLTERWQEDVQHGMKNWQIGALNEDMGPLPYRGGHSSAYDHAANFQRFKDSTFTVDESRWYRFLQKDKWLDPIEKPLANGTSDYIRKWTVNDPRIWGQVRILTEWVYRVLDTLIKERDPWLDTVLYGDFVYQDGREPGSEVQTEPAGMMLRARRIAEIRNASDYTTEARQRLEYLNRYSFLSFVDEWDSSAAGDSFMGVTMYMFDDSMEKQNDPGYYCTPITCLTASSLRGLCQDPPDNTPAEASFSRFNVSLSTGFSKLTPADASQLLHELMHAIVYHRRLERWGVQVIDQEGQNEPYIRDDQLSEVGISIERHLLGGSEAPISFHYHQPSPWKVISLKICSFSIDSENVRTAHKGYSQAPRDDPFGYFFNVPMKASHIWHVPAFFCALLFTDDYWNNVVAKKGRMALRPAAVSFSLSELQPVTGLRYYDIEVSQLSHAVDELRDPLNRVRNELRTRKERMRELRPWFDAEFPLWGTSIWGSSTHFRRLVRAFTVYHTRRDYRICCVAIAKLINACSTIMAERESVASVRMTCGLYLKLAYLMCASLPAKKLPSQSGAVKYKRSYTRAFGQAGLATLAIEHEQDQEAITNPTAPQIHSPPDHPINYLDVLRGLLFPTWGKPVDAAPIEWTNALVDSYRDLLRQRGQPGLNPQEDWADFNFQIPPYRRNADYHVLEYATENFTGKGPLPFRLVDRPQPMVAIQSQFPVDLKSMEEPGRKPPETYFTANQVAKEYLVLVITGEGTTEVWEPYGLDVVSFNPDGSAMGLLGSGFDQQKQFVFQKMPNGWTLKPDTDRMAVNFRLRLRQGRVRRRGRLMVMLTETEVRQMDGSYSAPLFKIWSDMVFNISEFLHIATQEERDVVLSEEPGKPGYLDTSKLPQGSPILERIKPYLCAMVRPENPKPWHELNNNPLLLTTQELRCHDNPDDGVYITINGGIYDITDYRQHHPAADEALVDIFGRSATRALEQAHPGGLAALDFKAYEHTIRKVGRLVASWTSGTPLPKDRFMLHGLVMHAPPTKPHWGGNDMTRHLTDPAADPAGEQLARELQDFYDDRFRTTAAKQVAAGADDPAARRIAFPQLARHNDHRAARGKWVMDTATEEIYDITSVLRHPSCFLDIPVPLQSAAGVPNHQVTGCSDWLKTHLSHRRKGRYTTVTITPTTTPNSGRKVT